MSGAGTNWIAELVLSDSNPEGEIAVQLTISDPTGNTRNLTYQQVDSANLLASYPFNGNANDDSEHDNNLTVKGGVSLTNDRYGRPNSAYLFDGSGDYLESSSTFTGLTDQLTAELWFYKPGEWEGSYQKLLGTGTRSDWGFLLSQGPGSSLRVYSHVRNQQGISQYTGKTVP